MNRFASFIGTLRWRIHCRLHPVRFRVVKNRFQRGLVLHVFWKDAPLGKGPGASLYCGRDEVLRFDCFGKPCGHWHVHVHEQERRGGPTLRLEFESDTVQGQIEQAYREVLRSQEHFLSSGQERLRRFRLDAKALPEAAHWMRARMREYAGL